MADLKAFGRQLTTYRLAAGYPTHEAASIATGVERSRIARHENGTGGIPQGKTLLRYERTYGLSAGSLTALLAGDGASSRRGSATTQPIARQLRQTVHEFLSDVRGKATLDDMDYITASLSDENILRLLGDASPDRPLTAEEQAAEMEIRFDELRAWLKRRDAIRKREARRR